jgi:hypothetical protein
MRWLLFVAFLLNFGNRSLSIGAQLTCVQWKLAIFTFTNIAARLELEMRRFLDLFAPTASPMQGGNYACLIISPRHKSLNLSLSSCPQFAEPSTVAVYAIHTKQPKFSEPAGFVSVSPCPACFKLELRGGSSHCPHSSCRCRKNLEFSDRSLCGYVFF